MDSHKTTIHNNDVLPIGVSLIARLDRPFLEQYDVTVTWIVPT